MYKLHNRYRAQMLISSNNRNALHHYLNTLESKLKPNNYVTIAIDVDPLEV
jgi:primosomal protein N'